MIEKNSKPKSIELEWILDFYNNEEFFISVFTLK